MPSFDVVSEVNKVELANSLDQANKEISNRFDFKDSDARVENSDAAILLYADDDFKIQQVRDVLINKMSKRGVDVRILGESKKEKISGNKLKESITIKNGISVDKGKAIVKIIKDSKLKVQATIQGESVRVSSAKRDELQAIISLLKNKIEDIPLQFNNFRD